jgi:ABC-2 type transport system permease protein
MANATDVSTVSTARPGLTAPLPPEVRGGPRHWLLGYRRTLVWDLADLRLQLPVLGAVLILQGAGFVLGIGLFFGHIPLAAAAFVSTGVPVVNLVSAGLIFEPQFVANQRETGSYEFLQSIPVPRSVTAMARYTVTLIISLPAVAISLVTAALRYDVPFAIAPTIVPAILATSLTAMLLGYAIAHAIAAPMVVRLVCVSLIFVIFGFSPVLFPAQQLPAWLVHINLWLPFGSMATIMRSALVSGLATDVPRAYGVVLAWAAAAGLVAARAVSHRR